ncbi:MAG: alginate O-acetyltransferase AlgX-related protein [Planctomycetota bacterium]
MKRWPLALRVFFDALVVSLFVTWALNPEAPARLLRPLVFGAMGVLLAPLLIPAWRRAWSLRLGAALRWPDFLAFNALLLLVALELGLRGLSLVSHSPLLAPPNSDSLERIERGLGAPGRGADGRLHNALGFPDEEFSVARPAGARRLLALGDSFAAGIVPYEENFLTLLDEQLDQRIGQSFDSPRPVELLNFGVVATGPEDYLHLWRTTAQAYAPDLVLLCLFVGNDIRDTDAGSILHRNSLMAFVVPQRLATAWRQAEAQRGVAGMPREGWPTFDEESYSKLEIGRAQLALREPGRKERAAWKRTLEILDELRSAIGERLRVVILPDEFQVNDALWAAVVGEEGARFERDLPQHRLTAYFAEHGVPCLDLLPALRAAEPQGATYQIRDSHWNARGNAVAAEALAAWLSSL